MYKYFVKWNNDKIHVILIHSYWMSEEHDLFLNINCQVNVPLNSQNLILLCQKMELWIEVVN